MGRIDAFRDVYAQVVTAGVEDRRVTEAFAAVAREEYLGEGPWEVAYGGRYATVASDDPACLYQNFAVAIDRTRGLNNGEPAFLARMIDGLSPRDGEHVVHVGTGSGYYTAIIAELVGPGGRVTAVEIDPGLAARSRANLARYAQVEVVTGSGADLALDGLDGLYVNAGATHPLPRWLDALAPKGRLVLPLTCDWEGPIGEGLVVRIERRPRGYAAKMLQRVWIYHCAGARNETAAGLLAEALQDPRWGEVGSLRRDHHEREPACWCHGEGWCLSTREPLDDGPVAN